MTESKSSSTDPSKPLDVEALRAEFLNVVFDEFEVEILFMANLI